MARGTALQQQRGGVLERSRREAAHSAVAVPEAKRVGLVLGLAVPPTDLQHQLVVGRGARRRDPRALPARQIRVAELELPVRRDLVDHRGQRGQPLETCGVVVLVDRVGEPWRDPDRSHGASVASPLSTAGFAGVRSAGRSCCRRTR